MKDLTRWGRDYLQVGNAMEIFRRNNVRFIAVNNGIDSEKPDTLEFAPFINIMSEWYAKDISKKVKTGIKTKGMSGKPIATEAPYGYVKDPDNKDFWIIDEEAAEVVRLIFRLFIGGKNRNQIAVYLKNEQIPTPTFYMKDRGRGTCKNKALNEDNRYKWNKATLTHILTRQEYCGDVVNFKTTKHFRDKRNHYVDRSQWQITENVHEPIIDRADFETAQRILENAPVKRPNGDGEIHPLSGLLFCKDCGAKMHIRIDYRYGSKRHVAYCSEYHKGKAKNPKCHSPHIIDADLLMQTVAEVLKKIEDYSISNRAEFEALVKKNLAMQQTDQTKKQQKRIPQITTRLEQIDKVLNKLYEDNALGAIPQDRYEQMSKKYSEEYYTLKTELAGLQEQLSAFENAGGRAQKFLKLTERHAAFTDLTGIALGFGEKNIGEVCRQNGVDACTFLTVVNFLVEEVNTPVENISKCLSIENLIRYLHNAHDYFLNFRLPHIRRKLVDAISGCPEDVAFVITKFFDEYAEEVNKHMSYEERAVFPYVRNLLEGKRDPKYNITIFRKRHDQIEMKITELKNILIKYYPGAGTNMLNSVLFDIFATEEDLASHTRVEDYLFVPAILALEKQL